MPKVISVSPTLGGGGPRPDSADEAGAIQQYLTERIFRRIVSRGQFPNGLAISPDGGVLAVAEYAANRMLCYSFQNEPNAACILCA